MERKIVIAIACFALLLIVSIVPVEEVETCNPNIQPQSIMINEQPYTKATPNHQRPCSAPILFGGNE
jgi:hypothetical protein